MAHMWEEKVSIDTVSQEVQTRKFLNKNFKSAIQILPVGLYMGP